MAEKFKLPSFDNPWLFRCREMPRRRDNDDDATVDRLEIFSWPGMKAPSLGFEVRADGTSCFAVLNETDARELIDLLTDWVAHVSSGGDDDAS